MPTKESNEIKAPAHLLEAFACELNGSMQRHAELFEQYAELYGNDAPDTAILKGVSQWQQQQIRLMATICHWLLVPPQPATQPVELNAYIWETIVSTLGQDAAGPTPHGEEVTAHIDLALITPLLEQYLRECYYMADEVVSYHIEQTGTHSTKRIIFTPTHSEYTLHWQSLQFFMNEHGDAAMYHHAMSLCYLIAMPCNDSVHVAMTKTGLIGLSFELT